MYRSFILDGVNESLKNKFQCHQNAALRAVMNVDMSFPMSKMSTELKVDSVRTEMRKSSCKMVFKGFYDLGPVALNNLFELHVPERAPRSSDHLLIVTSKCNTAFGQRNLTYRGSTYWNSLPISIKSSESVNSFKVSLKSYNGFD